MEKASGHGICWSLQLYSEKIVHDTKMLVDDSNLAPRLQLALDDTYDDAVAIRRPLVRRRDAAKASFDEMGVWLASRLESRLPGFTGGRNAIR